MGCSPSKGQLFTGVAGTGVHKAPLPGSDMGTIDLKSGEIEKQDLGTLGAEDLPLPAEEETPRVSKVAEVAANMAIVSTPEGITEIEVKVTSQGRNTQAEPVPMEKQMKKVEKRRKVKGCKQGRQKEKERKSPISQMKVDLPLHMVRAHQAAYAYLNPNISKYETLLSLLDQAAQTQHSLQPMMTAIVLRFEEVNQALEEMAEEGELMLKEHGDYMAWPAGMRALPPVPTKPNADMGSSEPPPDLLQQMLQHSTEKMRLVGSSVQGLGDTALEEAAEYFASLSKLLGKRLQAKRMVEGRLTQVLAHVEAATMQKPNPEDSALHSEDSGVGWENESLTGSERHRRHRESSGSGGTVRATPHCPLNSSPDQVCLNEGEEEDEDDDDDDYEDEEDEEEEVERPGRKRSNSSPPDPSKPFLSMEPKHSQGHLPKRPKTAASLSRQVRPKRSQSTECLHTLLELQKNQKDLDQRIKKMGNGRVGDRETRGANYCLERVGLRRHSSGHFKSNQTPSSLPVLTPQPPGRYSVRRLINTFSLGVDGRPGQSLSNVPSHISGSRRSRNPLLPDIGSGEGALVTNGNNNNNSWPVEGREDLDVDSLPPPPPEVLMDNSFQRTEETVDDEDEDVDEDEEASQSGRPVARQRSAVSQRLRASLQGVTVLPNRSSVRHSSSSISPARPVRQDTVAQSAEQPLEANPNSEKKQAATLYQQARKIIHLRNAAETPVKRNPVDQGVRGHWRAGVSLRQGSSEAETYPSSMPPTAPPVSRVRLPPSCPTVHHRLPSPPAFRSQPTPPTTRPASPRITRWARDQSCEENNSVSTSVSFCDARSVFCQNSQPSSQTWTPSCSSTLPRPWGEPSRGRLPTRGSQSYVRRTQSDQRPSLATEPEVSPNTGTTLTQTHRSEPDVTNPHERLDNTAVTEVDNQSDPSAVAPTALNSEQGEGEERT